MPKVLNLYSMQMLQLCMCLGLACVVSDIPSVCPPREMIICTEAFSGRKRPLHEQSQWR
jgi:hypothetical protein